LSRSKAVSPKNVRSALQSLPVQLRRPLRHLQPPLFYEAIDGAAERQAGKVTTALGRALAGLNFADAFLLEAQGLASVGGIQPLSVSNTAHHGGWHAPRR
jgi:hypothetical protein